MAERAKLLYLIGQFPAVNHGYLLAEVQHLRQLGLDVFVASISDPDRPPEQLMGLERQEAARTYYVKSLPHATIVLLHFAEFIRHPLHYLRALSFALRLAGGKWQAIVHHLAYFAEAILVGIHMRQRGLAHVHAHFSATVALIVARAFPVSMSFTVHGFGELHDRVSTHLAERINGSLFVRSVSRYGLAQLMLSCDRSQWAKLRHIPLGIDGTVFAPRPREMTPSTLRALCVGRLAPEKGQALLLEAVAGLRAGGFLLQVRMVGDGPDRAWLESQAIRLGIESNVLFEGWVTDQARLAAIYAETDLFVLPSLAEGIPIVLMEAMAMEIPCIAPRITGIPELIEHEAEGILFTVADVNELEKAIRTLLESPELRQRIGRQAREKVLREYDMARNTARFAALIEKQLESRTGPLNPAGVEEDVRPS